MSINASKRRTVGLACPRLLAARSACLRRYRGGSQPVGTGTADAAGLFRQALARHLNVSYAMKCFRAPGDSELLFLESIKSAFDCRVLFVGWCQWISDLSKLAGRKYAIRRTDNRHPLW
jgi:hypothetical protein